MCENLSGVSCRKKLMKVYCYYEPEACMKKRSVLIAIFLVLCLWAGVGSADSEYGKKGDVNGSGAVDSGDAAVILRLTVGLGEIDEAAAWRADVDGDGRVTAADAAYLLRLAVGFETTIKSCSVSFTLIATSDLRGAVWEEDLLGQSDSFGILNAEAYLEGYCGGIENLLVLDGGNSLFGSAASDDWMLYLGDGTVSAMTEVMKLTGYDGALLGDEDFVYGLSALSTQINSLQQSGTAVLCANILKNDATTAEKENVPWNDCVPYITRTFTNGSGERLTVGVIGLTAISSLEEETLQGIHGAEVWEPLAAYRYYEKELREKCDVIVVLFHGNLENDDLGATPEWDCARFLTENTDSVDLVLCGHTECEGLTTYLNRSGREVPVVGLNSSSATLCRADLTFDSYSNSLTTEIEMVSLSGVQPEQRFTDGVSALIKPVTELLNEKLCRFIAPLQAGEGKYAGDGLLTLLHKSLIYGAEQWAKGAGADLPDTVLSLTYPYLEAKNGSGLLSNGNVCVKDICALAGEEPSFSLLLIKGSELKAFLKSYAAKLGRGLSPNEKLYSLYGLSYSLSADGSGKNAACELWGDYHQQVGDDDVFAIIVAEAGEAGSLLSPYLDESFLPKEQRFLAYEHPKAEGLLRLEKYASRRELAAFLTNIGIINPIAEQNWSFTVTG